MVALFRNNTLVEECQLLCTDPLVLRLLGKVGGRQRLAATVTTLGQSLAYLVCCVIKVDSATDVPRQGLITMCSDNCRDSQGLHDSPSGTHGIHACHMFGELAKILQDLE